MIGIPFLKALFCLLLSLGEPQNIYSYLGLFSQQKFSDSKIKSHQNHLNKGKKIVLITKSYWLYTEQQG